MNRIRLISTRTGALLAVGLVVACGRFAASEPVSDVDTNTPVEAGTVWSSAEDAAVADALVDAPADASPDVMTGPVFDAAPTLPPCLEETCVDEAFGFFVSPLGNDENPGTRALPLRSIALAIAKLGAKSRVYACEGTYPEHLRVERALSLLGAFDCATWKRTGAKSRVQPLDAGYALEVSNVNGLAVADIAFEALPGTARWRGSIAVFVHGSRATFERVSVAAHEGHDGANASSGSNYDASLTASHVALRGRNASGTTGAAAQECTNLCVNQVRSRGGAGGNGGNAPTAGEAGKPDRGGGAGGAPGTCDVSLENGRAGTVGEDAARVPFSGVLDDSGWAPTSGASAKAGTPGQGGGGGGGAVGATLHAGGGGGCGGCGGAPGGVAEGGGASVALMSFRSEVTLTQSQLNAAKAGSGGAGAVGQPGQIGGNGGIQTAGGCPGGSGGAGGAGGASAGGAGGVSAGILVRGPKPALDGVTFGAGAVKGAKGPGGGPFNAGYDGQQGNTIVLP